MKPVYSHICLIALAGVLLSGPALASDVVVLGASNTHGKGKGRHPDGVPRSQAFPAQLEQLLRAKGCRARVVNAGIAGDTTGGMLARLPRVISPRTKLVILQPGGNDAYFRTGADRAGNIEAIRSQLSARGIELVLLENLGRIAREHRLADGQHFSAEGHRAFAEHLLPQVLSGKACG